MAGGAHRDAVMDGLALAETILRGDDAALTWLLGHGDNRAQASMLASMLADTLQGASDDPEWALTALRQGMETGEVP